MEISVFERIKVITEKRQIPNRKLAEAIGMSEQNFYRMFREQSIKYSVLEKIIKFLRVSESEFFSDEILTGSMNIESKKVVNEPEIPYRNNSNTKNALIEKDLEMIETLIKSIRKTIGNV